MCSGQVRATSFRRDRESPNGGSIGSGNPLKIPDHSGLRIGSSFGQMCCFCFWLGKKDSHVNYYVIYLNKIYSTGDWKLNDADAPCRDYLPTLSLECSHFHLMQVNIPCMEHLGSWCSLYLSCMCHVYIFKRWNHMFGWPPQKLVYRLMLRQVHAKTNGQNPGCSILISDC